ncbi:MAG: HAD family hydrolase [Haloarculaceae archaeon]
MSPSPAAVAFDLDETLAVTVRDRQTLLDVAADRAEAPGIDRAAYLEAHGDVAATDTREPIFDALLTGEADVDPAELATAYRRAIEDDLEPLAGAADLVTDLRERTRVGLLTDGPVAAQRGKLRELGWEDLFDAVVITGELPAGKPDERAFRAICDALDAAPADTVYVGDRPDVDVEGAAAAGLGTVQVLYDGGPPPTPAADATIERSRLVAALPALLADR